jgi:hypothetical protein
MEGITMEGTTMNNMRKNKSCSLCGQQGHNKRSCPQKPVDDTFVRDSSEQSETVQSETVQSEYIVVEETITTSPKEDILISLLLECQGYGIEPDTFEVWLRNYRPCPLKNVKYTLDKGISKDYIVAYLRVLHDIDIYL